MRRIYNMSNYFRYGDDELLGEEELFEHILKEEYTFKRLYRYYRKWRMDDLRVNGIGPLMNDFDYIVGTIPSWNAVQTCEFDWDNDYAVFEMKHGNTLIEEINKFLNQKPIGARRIATNAQIPTFLIKYYPKQEFGIWQFTVFPDNCFAKTILPHPIHMSEGQYAQFIYKLRNKPLPNELIKKLDWRINKKYKI